MEMVRCVAICVVLSRPSLGADRTSCSRPTPVTHPVGWGSPEEPKPTGHEVFLESPLHFDRMDARGCDSGKQAESPPDNRRVKTDNLSHFRKQIVGSGSLWKASRHNVSEHFRLLLPCEHHKAAWCGGGGGRRRRSSPLEEPLAGGKSSLLEEGEALAGLLVRVVKQEMQGCDLLVAFDDTYHQHPLLQHLLHLDTFKEVWHVTRSDDLLQASWSSPRCRGYLLVFHDLQLLANFTNSHHHVWDYHGRFVVVASSVQQLETIVASRKGRSTEHLVGLVQSGAGGEWGVYRGQVARGAGVRRVATWRGHVPSSQVALFPDQLQDLQGSLLKVVTFKWEPNVFYYRDQNGSLLYRYGVDMDVVNTLASCFNFTVQFLEPAAGELWGEQEEEDGSWTGMMGLLARGKAHLGAASIYVSAARASVADFTAPYDSRMSCFMARAEQPLPRWHALAYPFHASTWLALLLAFLAMVPLLLLVARASRHYGREATCLQSPGSTWLYSFGLHVREPQASLPRATPTQALLAFLWLYTMILALAYSTSLTAYLIVTKTPAAMETVRELRDSAVEVAGLGYFYRNALASAGHLHLQSLTRKYKGHKSVESIFPRVLEGRAVFLQNRAYIEFISLARFTKQGVSSMRIMKECFAPYSIALALQRHSPLKEKFDRVIGWLQQSGLIRQFFLNSLRLATSTEEYSDVAEGGAAQDLAVGGDGVTPISVDHLQGIFFIALLGWSLSSLAFLMEMKIH